MDAMFGERLKIYKDIVQVGSTEGVEEEVQNIIYKPLEIGRAIS